MDKIVKKVLVSVLCCILVCVTLIGCDSSQNTNKKDTNNKQEATSSKSSNDNTKEKTKSDDKAKTLVENIESQEKDNSTNGIKQNILGNLGQGETLQDMSIKDREISLKVNLGDNTNGLSKEDLACSRYSSVTDYLLDTGKFDTITVDFINVGKITMNVSESSSQNISGKEKKYFPLEEITKKLQKY